MADRKGYIKGGDRILERKDYSKWFFGLSAILAFSYVYATYDEFFTRRTYAFMQMEFRNWELALTQDEYADVLEQFEEEGKVQTEQDLRKKIEEAKENVDKNADVGKLQAELALQKSEYDHWDRTFKDVKSLQDSIFFKWKDAVHKGHEAESTTNEQRYEKQAERYKEEYNELQAQLDDLAAKRGEAEKAFKGTESKLAALDEVSRLEDKLADLISVKTDFEEKIKNIKKRDVREIKQIVNPKLGVGEEYTFGTVDRCESCHVNIDRGGFEIPAEQTDDQRAERFRHVPNRAIYTHPRRDMVLGIHPKNEYGCTVCHHGDGRATRFLPNAIPQTSVTLKPWTHTENWFVDARDKPHGLDHYWDRELLTSRRRAFFANPQDQREYYDLLAEYKEGTEDVDIEEFEQKYAEQIEIEGHFGSVEASCHKCHREQRWFSYGFKIDPETGREVADKAAPLYEKGKDLFIKKGCQSCHLVAGFEKMPRIAPELYRIRGKIRPEYLVDWLYDPKAVRADTRMPQFIYPPADGDPEPKAAYPNELTDEQKAHQREVATLLAAYIWQKSEPPAPMPFGRYPGGGDPARGFEIVKTVGCLACHTVDDGNGNRIGVLNAARLDDVGKKVQSADWIYNWIQEPTWHSASTRMPDLRLTREEARHVTAYLWQSSKDAAPVDPELREKLETMELGLPAEKLMVTVGCPSCHAIAGQEDASRIAPELTKFAEKFTYELAFGDADIEKTWDAWAEGKLRNPRQYIDERSSARMPNLHLKDDEVEALMVWLQAMRRPLVPEEMKKQFTGFNARIERGRELVEYYNCIGCHQLEGRGGDILANYVDSLPEDRQGALSPPNLKGEGVKIQSDWLGEFIRAPHTIRPWLQVRMPTFNLSDQQISDIIEYFRALEGIENPYDKIELVGATSESIARGQKLFTQYRCTNCHVFQGRFPPGELGPRNGPDLANLPERMRPEGVKRWIADPQAMMPGTAMPAFFYYTGDDGKLVPLRPTSDQEVNDIVNYLYAGPHVRRTTAMR